MKQIIDGLVINFSRDRDIEAIRLKLLPFLKDSSISLGQTVHCTLQRSGKIGGQVNHSAFFVAGDTVEALAGEIAEFLTEYAKGKGLYRYGDATISIRCP